jgi:hypothetical protein
MNSNPEEEGIQLDDITFDDVIGGDGVSTDTDTIEPLAQDDVEDEETPEENILDDEDDDSPEESEEEEDEDDYEEEDEDDEDAPADDSVIAEVLSKLGYETEDIQYEDSAEGIANMTADLADKMADERIDEVLANFPQVKEHLEYVLAGGDSDKFLHSSQDQADFGGIEVGKDDAKLQKAILSEYFAYKGHEEEIGNDLIEDYEDSGRLFEKAEKARLALAKVQDHQRTEMVNKQQEQQRLEIEQKTEFWEDVADTLRDTDDFAGINIPTRQKREFFEYISTPIDKNGLTQRDLDHAEAGLDVKLAIDYLMYKGFDLNSFIDKKARTKQTKSLYLITTISWKQHCK